MLNKLLCVIDMYVFMHHLQVPTFHIYIYFENQGTFHGQALRTLHGDPNLGMLTVLQQPAPSKFKVSSMTGFEPWTMWTFHNHSLLTPHPHHPSSQKKKKRERPKNEKRKTNISNKKVYYLSLLFSLLNVNVQINQMEIPQYLF